MVENKKAGKKYGEILARSFRGSESKEIHFEKSSNTFYPSDQANFPVNVGVAVLKKKKGIGYYMNRIHTKRDVIFEEENIRLLRDGAKRFLTYI